MTVTSEHGSGVIFKITYTFDEVSAWPDVRNTDE